MHVGEYVLKDETAADKMVKKKYITGCHVFWALSLYVHACWSLQTGVEVNPNVCPLNMAKKKPGLINPSAAHGIGRLGIRLAIKRQALLKPCAAGRSQRCRKV